MRLTVLGSSGGTPSRTNPASGYLIEHGRTSLWLDAGTGTFMELARHIDPGRLDVVVLSHRHVDHCADIFGLYGYLAFGPSGTVPVPVLGPDGLGEHLAEFARAGDEHVFRSVFDLGSADAPTQIGDLKLRFATTTHPVPTVATRIEAGGVALVYSGDSGPGGGLPGLAAGCDVLLCEATLLGERTEASYPYHLTASEVGEMAATAGVGCLIVTHIPPTGDEGRAVAEARAAFDGSVEWAAPGSTFDV